MLLYQDFVKFAVQTNQKYSRGNGEFSTFLHSHMFIAFVLSFLSGPLVKKFVILKVGKTSLISKGLHN